MDAGPSLIEGPIAMTECSAKAPSLCELEPVCPVRSNWRRINQAVRQALENLTLADMTRPPPTRRNHTAAPLTLVTRRT